MRYSPFYQTLLDCADSEQVFSYLMSNLTDSIKYWDYFVGWNKVLSSVDALEMDLILLNYLVGKENVEAALRHLLIKHPSVANLIPLLLACRDRNFKILTDFRQTTFQWESFSFRYSGNLELEELDKICRFAKETGLLDLFSSNKIKNVPDYVLGIEVGLDSNARKNRGGTKMEAVVAHLLSAICAENGFDYMAHATAKKVNLQWGINLQVDKTARDFDFAVRRNDQLYLIETNFYGGGGSKLKSTAGEYKAVSDFLKRQGHQLIWVTDGLGWKSTKNALRETFDHIDHLLNLKMVSAGVLASILGA